EPTLCVSLSLHDALPILEGQVLEVDILVGQSGKAGAGNGLALSDEPFYGEQLCRVDLVGLLAGNKLARIAVEHLEFLRIYTLRLDRKSTRLDYSHVKSPY